MIRYVERDESGAIVGHFASPQPGKAEEEMRADAPEMQAYEARAAAQRAADELAAREPQEKMAALEKRVGVLEAQVGALRERAQ